MSDTVADDAISVSTLSHLSSPQKKPRPWTAEPCRREVRNISCEAQGSLPMPLPFEPVSRDDSRDDSPQEWELYKDDIEQLYMTEHKKLEEVMEVMRDRGFDATYVFPTLRIDWYLSY
jgi:hypothetical protein